MLHFARVELIMTAIETIDQAGSFAEATSQPFAVASDSFRARPTQNWILDPLQDLLFIIAAPLIALGLAVFAMQHYGAARGATLVITAHVVLTVAHHLPTFIRIYGDVDLFRRFKWSFLLGPVIPLLFCAAVLAYINYHSYPVEYFLYLYIFLALWDPWHFLRQHFGFMRIYDRNNQAPAALAANMDWAVCAIWFVHIMAASADWIPGLLEDLYRTTHIPLLLVLPQGFMPVITGVTWWLAVLASTVYAGYLLWCMRRGYYISLAKLALLAGTFGVMYFTYTPNEWILWLVPAWGFKVGFATVGIVHMTQYLAIVWRYDQRIAQQGRARPNWFTWLHNRRTPVGVVVAAGIYVLFCVAYGDAITTDRDSRWLMSALLAIGFTSTLMHYYFDGFIWRVRHQQNREALGLQEVLPTTANPPVATLAAIISPGTYTTSENIPQSRVQTSMSWWSSAAQMSASRMLLRQLLYFGLPMGILTAGALSVWNGGNTSYVRQMYEAQTLSQQGHADTAAAVARMAYANMQGELPFAQKMVDLKPSSANQAQLAFLVYNESLYKNRIMPALAGLNPNSGERQAHKAQISRAAELLQNAVLRGEDPAHPGREQLTLEDAARIASSWRREAQ